jgi:hypothetical protein
MNPIKEFCEKRKITKTIESAFSAYCKTDYAQRFDLKEGDTIARIVANMTAGQVEHAWLCFVSELKELLVYHPPEIVGTGQEPS